jgi:hypothetical protein
VYDAGQTAKAEPFMPSNLILVSAFLTPKLLIQSTFSLRISAICSTSPSIIRRGIVHYNSRTKSFRVTLSVTRLSRRKSDQPTWPAATFSPARPAIITSSGGARRIAFIFVIVSKISAALQYDINILPRTETIYAGGTFLTTGALMNEAERR